MKERSLTTLSLPPQTIAVVVAVLLVIAAGGVGLIVSNNFAPLYVLAGLIAVLVMIFWVKNPLLGFLTAVWLVFLPLGLIPAELQSFLNRAAAVGAFTAWSLSVIFKHRKIVINPAVIIMAGFLLWGLMTLAWSTSPSQSLYQLQIYTLRWLLFLVLGTNFLSEGKSQTDLMRVIALNGWILMFTFIFTLITSGYTPGTRLKIAGMNENEAAVLGLLFIPAVLWNILTGKGKNELRHKLIAAIYILLTSLLAVMSGSRGSMISLAVLMLGFLFIRETRIYPLLALGITTLVGLIYPQLFATLIYRLTIESSESLLGGREYIWKAAMLMISHHPWLGVGLGNAPTEIIPYLRYFAPIYTSSVALHNPLLTIWAETGLFGLLLYSGILISSIFIFAMQFLRETRQQASPLTAAYGVIGISMLAYLVSWFKGGGSESEFAFFLAVALLNLKVGVCPERAIRTAKEHLI